MDGYGMIKLLTNINKEAEEMRNNNGYRNHRIVYRKRHIIINTELR